MLVSISNDRHDVTWCHDVTYESAERSSSVYSRITAACLAVADRAVEETWCCRLRRNEYRATHVPTRVRYHRDTLSNWNLVVAYHRWLPWPWGYKCILPERMASASVLEKPIVKRCCKPSWRLSASPGVRSMELPVAVLSVSQCVIATHSQYSLRNRT